MHPPRSWDPSRDRALEALALPPAVGAGERVGAPPGVVLSHAHVRRSRRPRGGRRARARPAGRAGGRSARDPRRHGGRALALDGAPPAEGVRRAVLHRLPGEGRGAQRARRALRRAVRGRRAARPEPVRRSSRRFVRARLVRTRRGTVPRGGRRTELVRAEGGAARRRHHRAPERALARDRREAEGGALVVLQEALTRRVPAGRSGSGAELHARGAVAARRSAPPVPAGSRSLEGARPRDDRAVPSAPGDLRRLAEGRGREAGALVRVERGLGARHGADDLRRPPAGGDPRSGRPAPRGRERLLRPHRGGAPIARRAPAARSTR